MAELAWYHFLIGGILIVASFFIVLFVFFKKAVKLVFQVQSLVVLILSMKRTRAVQKKQNLLSLQRFLQLCSLLLHLLQLFFSHSQNKPH